VPPVEAFGDLAALPVQAEPGYAETVTDVVVGHGVKEMGFAVVIARRTVAFPCAERLPWETAVAVEEGVPTSAAPGSGSHR
jgi:hypothetical protein